MRKKLSIIIVILLSLLLFSSCSGGGDETNEKTTDGEIKTTEEQKNDVSDETNGVSSETGDVTDENSDSKDETSEEKTEKETEMTDITTEKPTETTTGSQCGTEEWYIDSSSVQTEFEYGERFNYDGIVAVRDIGGEKTEYPEDDLYIEHEPVLTYPGKYVVSVEVLSEEIILTYTITVKDVDTAVVLEKAPSLSLGAEKSCKLEFEDIDLSHIKSKGDLIVDDEYASGKKYVQNYGKVGNCFGFKVSSDKDVEGAKIIIRMANFAVTMIYPAENIALYQNYVSIEENTRIEFDPDYYLITRAPSMDGQSGADTSLVWCEVTLENITLSKGENSFMLAVIGGDVPFLDCIEIIVP